MSSEVHRTRLYNDLIRRGWKARSAARAVVAAHPVDDDVAAVTLFLADILQHQSFGLRWELGRGEPGTYLDELVQRTLRSHQEAARSENDLYYTRRYLPLLDPAEGKGSLEGEGYLEPEAYITPPARPRIREVDSRRTARLRVGALGGSAVVVASTAVADYLQSVGEMRSPVVALAIAGTIIALVSWTLWLDAERIGAADLVPGSRWGSSWTRTGWLVPGLNLFVPYVMMLQTERGYRAALRGNPIWQKEVVGASSTTWWTSLMTGTALLVGGIVGTYTGYANLDPRIMLTTSAFLLTTALIAGDKSMRTIASLREDALAATRL